MRKYPVGLHLSFFLFVGVTTISPAVAVDSPSGGGKSQPASTSSSLETSTLCNMPIDQVLSQFRDVTFDTLPFNSKTVPPACRPFPPEDSPPDSDSGRPGAPSPTNDRTYPHFDRPNMPPILRVLLCIGESSNDRQNCLQINQEFPSLPGTPQFNCECSDVYCSTLSLCVTGGKPAGQIEAIYSACMAREGC